MFITVEGADYSGKTTQVGVIKDYYESLGRVVTVTREPGGTSVGMKIREILVGEDQDDPLSVTEQLLLLYAARSNHVDKVIIPALERGEIVVCDRYIDSTYVYQGLIHNHKEIIDSLLRVPTLSHLRTRSDYTFYYDIDYETMSTRMASRGVSNALDEKYARLGDLPIDAFRRHFHELAQERPGAIRVIDGRLGIGEVTEATVAACKSVLEAYGSSGYRSLYSLMSRSK